MPYFTINTNMSRHRIPESFLNDMTVLIAKTLGKPESFVCVQVNADQQMSWGANSSDPCAYCSLVSCGKLGADVNKDHTIALMGKINEVLNIPKERMYIGFTDVPATHMGWNDMTIHDLIQSRQTASK